MGKDGRGKLRSRANLDAVLVDEGGGVDDDELVDQLRPHQGQKEADATSETVTYREINIHVLRDNRKRSNIQNQREF